MSVRLTITGDTYVYDCATPEDAFKIRLLESGQNPNLRPAGTQAAAKEPRAALHQIPASKSDDKVKAAHDFLTALRKHDGQRLSSDLMVSLVGAQSVHGLGPKLNQHRKVLGAEDIDLDAYITKIKTDPAAPAIWSISWENGA
jgi:hypothetical protein